MDTKKEKKLLHRAWIVVALLLVIMAGAILEEISAVKGSALYNISGVLAALAYVGASGYCAYTLNELEKLG